METRDLSYYEPVRPKITLSANPVILKRAIVSCKADFRDSSPLEPAQYCFDAAAMFLGTQIPSPSGNNGSPKSFLDTASSKSY